MQTPLIYPPRADERIMQRKQVIEMAAQGKISWVQAAEVLKITPRQMRRIRARYERCGELGLFDHRKRPSSRRIPEELRSRVIELYRSEYRDFSVLHFYEMMERKHGLKPAGYYWLMVKWTRTSSR